MKINADRSTIPHIPDKRSRIHLNDGEVHVWCLRPGARSTLTTGAVDTLSADERARARRFRLEADRHRFMVCRASLRRILAGYVQTCPSQLSFSYNEKGKPCLDEPSGSIRFNLSHSRDLALVAVTRGGEVGVDIEFIDPSLSVMRTARKAFTPAEYSRIDALAPPLRTSAFFTCWTRNEAVLKAMGTGFSQREEMVDRSEKFTVKTLKAAQNYEAAVAVAGPIKSIRHYEICVEHDYKADSLPFDKCRSCEASGHRRIPSVTGFPSSLDSRVERNVIARSASSIDHAGGTVYY